MTATETLIYSSAITSNLIRLKLPRPTDPMFANGEESL